MKTNRHLAGRILGRRMARQLSAAELRRIGGNGTSYAGTGGCDAQGRAADIVGVDCVDGCDTYKC